jgi:hypothetical protein
MNRDQLIQLVDCHGGTRAEVRELAQRSIANLCVLAETER